MNHICITILLFLFISSKTGIYSEEILSVCPNKLIEQCKPCTSILLTHEGENVHHEYNCSLPGLESVTPGKYKGINVNYLSFVTETSSPSMPIRAKEFIGCTGGTISFSEGENVFEDPIADLGTKASTGQEVYDAYFMSYSHFPEASQLGLAEHLNDRIRDSNYRLKWEDVLPKVRSMGEYRDANSGLTHLDFLMYDGDFFVPLIRLDLLEKHNMSIPNTWDEVVTMVKFFNDTDLNDDGEPDYGFCHFPRLGAGYWDYWWAEALYSTWATFSQTQGIKEGFFFDPETMEPNLNDAFKRSAEIWKVLWRHGADGCITNNFREGRCAIGYAPPGCWKGVFLSQNKGNDYGIMRRDVNGTLLWKPTLKNGRYAEPFRIKPFGSTQIFEKENQTMVSCDSYTCPKGEIIPKYGHTVRNPTLKLPESPLNGQIINRAPFYWSGGLGTLIRKSTSEIKKDFIWDFFVYTNSPETSAIDVAKYASWLDSWRYSQLNGKKNFLKAGWSDQAYSEHREIMLWALGRSSNGAYNLRIPGLLDYTYNSLGFYMQKFINDEMSLQEMSDNVESSWNEITLSRGKLSQLEIYRSSLGMDPHSSFDLCQLHRKEMDKKDPNICAQYDPIPMKMLIPAIVVPIAIIILSAIIIIQMDKKRRAADSVWIIKEEELIFDTPFPEIIGRGTFGLVLLAEYRGTQVAVKRVMPPKEILDSEFKHRERNSLFKRSKMQSDAALVCDKRSSNNSSISSSFESRAYLSSLNSNQLTSSALHSLKEPTVTPTGTQTMSTKTRKQVRRASLGTSNETPLVLPDIPPQILSNKSVTSSSSSDVKPKLEQMDSSKYFDFLAEDEFKKFENENGSESNRRSSVLLQKLKQVGSASGVFNKVDRKNTERKSITAKDEYKRLKADFISEMRHLSKLRHPCITTVMGAVIEKNNAMLVMEYMDHGSLFDLLHNETVVLEGEVLFPILKDIAQGMRFLHVATPIVLHGDLKSANVLVDAKFRAKVADFGLTQKKKVGPFGTPYWMAPELLNMDAADNTAASDVYSFGIVLYEVYSRKIPYEGEDFDEVIKAICDPKIQKRPPIPKGCPLLIEALVRDCVVGDVDDRPTFEEIDHRLKRMNPTSVQPNFDKGTKLHRTNALLHEVFPPKIAEALRDGKRVEPEHKEMVTIFFSDIVGFTTISTTLPALKVSSMLDRLYYKFDELSHKHDIFKIETIGDAYIAVTNLIKDQSKDHVIRIAKFSIDAMAAARNTLIDEDDPSKGHVIIRIGFHSGPAVANVIGYKHPKYSIFGDSVNTASRMESTCTPHCIQCSEKSATILKSQKGSEELEIISRGQVSVKGKGEMNTFWIRQARGQ